MSAESGEPEPDATALLEEALGYRFSNRALLERALQHASYAHENAGSKSNERLEFLGDAVLGLAVGHLLFEAHPDWREGDLTRALHQLVDRRALASLGRELDIGPCLRLGRTEQHSGGWDKDSILADATEAVAAAMYLDGGLPAVLNFARRVFAPALAPDAPRATRDPKTRFQEWAMAQYGIFPSYEVIDDTGVEGDECRFTVRLSLEGQPWTEGSGRTKRGAAQAAAESALARREELRTAHSRELGRRYREGEAPGGDGA